MAHDQMGRARRHEFGRAAVGPVLVSASGPDVRFLAHNRHPEATLNWSKMTQGGHWVEYGGYSVFVGFGKLLIRASAFTKGALLDEKLRSRFDTH